MNYINFEAGNKTYKLRLTTRNTVLLERQIGCNPVNIFGNDPQNPQIPTITTMVAVLHAAAQQYNHGVSMDNAYDIFEDFLADGHSITDFIPVIIELYQTSGIMPKPKANQEEKVIKND